MIAMKKKKINSKYLEIKSLKNLFLPLSILLVFSVLLLALRWISIDIRESYIIGLPASRNYFVLSSMTYKDKKDTERLRFIAKDSIASVLVKKSGQIREVREKLDLVETEQLGGTGVSQSLVELVDALPEKREKYLLKVVSSVGLSLLDLRSYRESIDGINEDTIWNEISTYDLSDGESNLAIQILKEIMVAVIYRDGTMAERLKSVISGAIKDVPRELQPGDIIVAKGNVISHQIADLLRRQGYPEASFPIRSLLLILIVFPFSFFWVHSCGISGCEDKKNGYIAFIFALGLSVSYLSSFYGFAGFGTVSLAGIAYLTLSPARARNVIVAGTMGIAAFYADVSSIVFGEIISMGIVTAMLGKFFFNKIDSRSDLWLGLVQLGVGAGLVLLAIRWGFFAEISYMLPVQLILAALFWATVIMITLFLAEGFFDILSPLRLVEISQPDHPLQKRLQREAPGTYHHSQMVALLAESAAEDLGLNSRLVKAGAYFHDIGKLKRPQFFIENQFSKKNFHDDISPVMSALVIISHVREGLDLADEYKLPGRISQFIAEHHGTTCLNYFYKKALKVGLDPSKSQFDYPGPIPSSRETGLVMLADSVEAAVRAEKNSIKGIRDLSEIVDAVIASKIEAGQMDDTGFTMRDFSLIKESMLHNLQSMYHTRNIKPVEEEKKEVKVNARKEGTTK